VHLSIWIALLVKHRKHRNLFDLLPRAQVKLEMQLIFVAALGLDDCFLFFYTAGPLTQNWTEGQLRSPLSESTL